MPQRPIQWGIAANQGRSKEANTGELINLFPEALPKDSLSSVALYGTPGLISFVTLPTTPILALFEMNEVLYAATATKFYSIQSNGSYAELGTVVLSGYTSIAGNGSDIIIVGNGKGYKYNTSGSFSELDISDNWYPSNNVIYQDGRFIFSRTSTTQIFISELDAATFDATEIVSTLGIPGNVVGVISDHREVWVFKEKSTEIRYNSGAADFPFETMQGAYIEKGCIAVGSIAKADNTVFWLGHDYMVYRADNYNPVRISTHAVEFDIKDGVVSDAIAYTYYDEGHLFYVLTFPTQNVTWCFDISTGLWHKRSHFSYGRHASNCHAWCFSKNLVGDYTSGDIYQLDLDTYTDNGTALKRTAISPPIHADRNLVTMNEFEVDMDTGVGNVTGDGSDPEVMFTYSDDGGQTWSNEIQMSVGLIGEYTDRVIFRKLGQFRQRAIKIEISDPVEIVMHGAYVDIEVND